MLENLFNSVLGLNWFRRCFMIFIVWTCIKLTEWGIAFSQAALQAHADLTGTAATIGAVFALPLGILTLLIKDYIEKRSKDNDGTDSNS